MGRGILNKESKNIITSIIRYVNKTFKWYRLSWLY